MTMTELADLAGISQTSVSLILNGKANGKIALEKQQLVLELARSHNYRPNSAAKNLRSRKPYVIGVVMPTPCNLFYADMVSLLQAELSSRGYMPLFSFWTQLDGVDAAFETVLKHSVDGIICWEYRDFLEKENVPLVIFDQEIASCDTVMLDFTPYATQAVNYLYKLGHRRIGYIGNPGDRRFLALSAALGEAGMTVDQKGFHKGGSSFELGVKMADKLLQTANRPTAILTHDDTTAIGVMFHAAKLGIAIPEALSIIGFDNLANSEYTLPPLTTFDPGCAVLSVKLVELMLHRLSHPAAPLEHQQIAPKLIIRNSCGNI